MGPSIIRSVSAAAASWPAVPSLLAEVRPVRLALGLTVVLFLMTIGVIVLCLQAFDKGISTGKKPSKVRGQFYSRVIGWLGLALILGGVVWYFDGAMADKLTDWGIF